MVFLHSLLCIQILWGVLFLRIFAHCSLQILINVTSEVLLLFFCKQDLCQVINDNFLCTSRFGSIISGAIQSKLSTKKGKSGKLNSSSTSKKHQRGSFSFLGGMQVKYSPLLSWIVQFALCTTSYCSVKEMPYTCFLSKNEIDNQS